MRNPPEQWSADEIDILADSWAKGMDMCVIAQRLGRTRDSVRGAIARHRLGRRGGARARRCMTCLKLFQPDHRFNRICPRCKQSDEWRSGSDLRQL